MFDRPSFLESGGHIELLSARGIPAVSAASIEIIRNGMVLGKAGSQPKMPRR